VRADERAPATDAFDVEAEPAWPFDPARMPVRIAAE
jgi:hypothetical protein